VRSRLCRLTGHGRQWRKGEPRAILPLWRDALQRRGLANRLPVHWPAGGGLRAVRLRAPAVRPRYHDPLLGRFISADTIVPEPSEPQDLNRYAYVRNNPLRFVDPSGHRLSDPADPEHDPTVPLPPPPPPWYTPIVVGSAKAWWWADANFGEFGRYLEAERLTIPVQLSHSGNLFHEGLNLHFDSPFVSSDVNLHLRTNVYWGDRRAPRIDRDKVTVKIGNLSEIYNNWEGDEYGIVLKGVAASTKLKEEYEVNTRGKGTIGIGSNPPLNPYLLAGSSADISFTGPLLGTDLTVKAKPTVASRTTFHGGPAALVAAPVAAYYGGSAAYAAYIALTSGGAATRLLPQFAR